MDNISFGQYVPGNSWIYKLDPRMKIFLNMMYKGRARMCKRRGILNTGRETLTNILKKLVR